jgi:hypothetical protein
VVESLSIYAGPAARRRRQAEGWKPERFDTLLGASGGAKLLGIAGLDEYLFGEFLGGAEQTLHLIGSSIGSWRHAALAQRDPLKALRNLHHGYLHQEYREQRPSPQKVSEVSLQILDDFLGTDGTQQICSHRRFRSHVVTARGRGPAGSANSAAQGLGLGLAAVGNALHRKSLQAWFQRVVFSSHGDAGLGFRFDDFDTLHAPLRAANTRQALHASGSIPFILTGERDIPEAPRGQYWDGGIVDYHFDLGDYRGEGLLLYPHFGPDIIPGWFDKFLPWRGTAAAVLERVVLLCPSAEFLATLPHGKIPDRRDFPRMSQSERVQYWQACVDASARLGEDLDRVIYGPDPLASVREFS